MLSLLALSLALSTPASATQTVTPSDPLVSPDQSLVLIQPNGPMIVEEEEAARPFDDMEIHPDTDVCYKIRAYIFTKGRNPQFLRETTCGPKVPTVRKMDGTKPGFMPLELKAKPDVEPRQ